MLKKFILASALSLPFVITTGPAIAFEFPDKPPVGELSANVSYYTNYIWRGEEQTGGMSIQGGFDYSVNLVETYIDAYVGTWAANLNTAGFGMELDYYGGLPVQSLSLKTIFHMMLVCFTMIILVCPHKMKTYLWDCRYSRARILGVVRFSWNFRTTI